MEVSSAFVVVMGMGVTFVGLSCIIFLTLLMGKILSRPEPPKAEPVVPAAPAVPADGLTDEVKVAIMAAIAQQPGFKIVVLPIWYKTWWAILLFIATFTGFITFVFRFFLYTAKGTALAVPFAAKKYSI